MGSKIIIDPDTQCEIEVPEYSSEEQALDRARRIASGSMPVIRMFPEIGSPIPLWGDRGPLLDWEELGITPELHSALLSWQATWEAQCHYERGWTHQQDFSEWRTAGDLLYERLTQALWTTAAVCPEYSTGATRPAEPPRTSLA